MNAYVCNILENAKVDASPLVNGYQKPLLYDEVLSNLVPFSGPVAAIEAKWGLNYYADTVALLGCNWIDGSLKIVSQGETVFNEEIRSKGINTLIKLPELFMVSELILELRSMENIEIGLLFIGKKIELPLFANTLKYKFNVNSKAARTGAGRVYGLKKPSLRSFDISIYDIDNSDRLKLEAYIDEVQFVKPHIVELYEADEFPPLYATLTDAGASDKLPDFRWNTALKYMEAK